MDGKSFDVIADNIDKLRSIFPETFSEGKVDFRKLRDVLGDLVISNKEHYELAWAGKSESRSSIQQPTTSTLLPVRNNSVNYDNSQNIFIEGDNLEALKILQKSYFGKVKAIYIDPPYNTGNDSFLYPDNFSEFQSDYNKRSGWASDSGTLEKDTLWQKNTRESGRFHSSWLSMMYPRLYLAKNMLSQDGVIFISIDDNEQSNLKLLMDEIFGEENFIVQIIWRKRSSPPNDKIIGANHDYILAYARNITECKLNLRERTVEQLNRYQNPDNHPKGAWTSGDLMANVKGGRYTASLHFGIVNPNTGDEHYPSNNGNWRFNKEKIQSLINNNEIYFGEDNKGRPKLKRFLKDVKEGVTYPTIWDFVPLNSDGTAEISDILGNMNIFDTPKPRRLIKELIKLGTDDGDLIMDFFAGSCTTAHAVLELNAETNGNRKFIVVQLAEQIGENTEAYRNGYHTIAEIGRERIKRTIRKLDPDELLLSPHGFRYYRIAPSNFKVWRADIETDAELLSQLELFLNAENSDAMEENMLVELILKSGRLLTTEVRKIDVDAVFFFHLTEANICICLKAFNDDIREKIYQLRPQQVVVLNSLFHSDELLTNTKLEFSEAKINFTLI
ncbi:adenine-specific DNA-methyltransferase [Pedobacter westerhofensis]|uniref:site-specific DNA-methyltransferase (adenine-specific) n=1 Tax=Pedobacter westerhofensis TaxID=425512 RepID=A0A521FVW3_9SPHI|nr:site-specific DNA-methyltransferase [Pedobacter westerhofensis]SMO99861.1 adenine-specific DNA-methyltransferase [Pedobacter westerhofensis]